MAEQASATSCGDTVVAVELSPAAVEAAKRHVIGIAGPKPVVFQERLLASGQIELTVMAASLTPHQAQELQQIGSDRSSVQRHQAIVFDRQISFDLG